MSERQEIARQTLSERVYDWIRREILAGRLNQGDRLSEVHIAETLGVSATPVREALRMLSGAGLVEYLGHRGVRVAHFSDEQIQQCFAVRISLERLALREAMSRMTDAEAERLIELAQQNSQAADAPAETVFELNRRFHAYFIEKAANPWLIDFLRQLGDALTVARLPLFRKANTPQTTKEHVAIAEAIRERDPDKAEQWLQAHILRVRDEAVAAHRRDAERPQKKEGMMS